MSKTANSTKEKLLHEKMQKKLLDDDYVIDNAEILNWSKINNNYIVSDRVVRECNKYIKWTRIVFTQQLSQDIIQKYIKRMVMADVLRNQKLTIETINKLKFNLNKFHWDILSKHQQLSFEFINENINNLTLTKLQTEHLTDDERDLIQSYIVLNKLL